MVQIVWTDIALKDLQEIYHYISKDSVHYAENIVVRLVERVHILKNFPQIGRIVPEYDNPNYKELIEGNYRIVYWIKSDDFINVLRVHHSKMILY